VKHIWTDNARRREAAADKRVSPRRELSIPGRMTWKDHRGTTRFASVITRNVSDHGVLVECRSAVSIPMYRLVQFQLERDVRDSDNLPESLRSGRILSAVYRVMPATTSGRPQCLALRLMVDPRKRLSPLEAPAARATA
jgi:hypothetical protein